jgi:hypothetical protein
LLVSIHGQSVQEDASGYRRAILARVELTISPSPIRKQVLIQTDVDVELAQGPPAIGAEPPERIRQGRDRRTV